MSPWEQTHVIEHNGRKVAVMEYDGGLYTEAEWQHCDACDWSLDPEKGLVFQGQVPPGVSSFTAEKQILLRMPRRRRETYLLVEAYRREHPLATLVEACHATGTNLQTYGSAKRALRGPDWTIAALADGARTRPRNHGNGHN